jgi:hypothetical protein
MVSRVMTLGLALATIAGCQGDPPNIAGHYDLVSVNGAALPCCVQTDSVGTRVTFVGGSLRLGEGAPEAFAATPAGWMPGSCVVAVPNGARIDTSGVVTLPDGRRYRIPTCVERHHAPYTMIVTRRYDYPGDSSHTLSVTSSGVYAWSDGDGAQPQLVALLNASLIGPLTRSAHAVEVRVRRAQIGPAAPVTPSDPEYRFFRSTP